MTGVVGWSMRLRTFTAASMKEAIAIVREEMGPDAIIVSAHEHPRGRGVEVRAATESAAPLPQRAPAPERPVRKAAAPPQAAEMPQKGLAQIAVRRVGAPGEARRQSVALNAALREILIYHGLDDARITAILDAARRPTSRDPGEMLATALEARLSFVPLAVKPRKPVMLMGGPGVGKTVTTAKLAARARLAGHPVAVITTDTLRSGAIEQLAKLLSLMGTKLITADSPDSLSAVLARPALKDAAVFIDTPGTNMFAMGERRDLRRFLAAGDMEPIFVLAAGTDTGEAGEHARLFAEIGTRRYIVTRLDAARRFGSVIAAGDEGRLSLAQVSLSPYLSEPLAALSPISLSRILLAQTAHLQSAQSPTASVKEQKAS
jgi:flagellar biosynthesis protein FlhF